MEADIFFSRLRGVVLRAILEDFSCPFKDLSQTGNGHGRHARQAGRALIVTAQPLPRSTICSALSALNDAALHKALGIMTLLRISSTNGAIVTGRLL
ncbi:MAG: hypothetical protein E5V92_17405 [Mesorhizobium sp.]|nr:MAG: hypothetical protein EOS61_26220 [Mesorhizobium sp.]TIV70272.1 MAG: hypothetical protein E5V89_15320 [Mesorhizobium sp.]TIV96222.1 MAG: hypothetical protein E5V85_18610 [Mesorhizobium sp.]TJW83875.1 MAG: hypothetical protein E5V92_17405 [Mesorhizobium sp.]